MKRSTCSPCQECMYSYIDSRLAPPTTPLPRLRAANNWREFWLLVTMKSSNPRVSPVQPPAWSPPYGIFTRIHRKQNVFCHWHENQLKRRERFTDRGRLPAEKGQEDGEKEEEAKKERDEWGEWLSRNVTADVWLWVGFFDKLVWYIAQSYEQTDTKRADTNTHWHTHRHIHISRIAVAPMWPVHSFVMQDIAWRPGNRTTQLSMHYAHEISLAVSNFSLHTHKSTHSHTPFASLSVPLWHVVSLWIAGGISMHAALEWQIKNK